MKRAKHTLSFYRMVTGNMGQLMPIGMVPVLPGDTFQHHTDVLIRVSPLNTPVMHPVSIRVHHWFVPNRILWDGWEDFITGGKDGNDSSTIPFQQITKDEKGTIFSYLGAPSQETYNANALPLYAVNKIWNEFYRDQDLQTEQPLTNNTLHRVAWEKDFYTTARPWTQKGEDVVLPIAGGDPPIYTTETGSNALARVNKSGGGARSLEATSLNTPIVYSDTAGQSNLFADFSNLSQVSVNDFRTGFALQRYKEARARYGSRFTEYLRYLGITPSDSRLQRPEFLAGGTARLNFSEVLQTTPNTEANQAGVGDMYGHGIAGVRTNRYRKFFEEHGYVISLLSVRPKALYMDHTPREFLKTTKEDYFQRELAHIGQQEVWAAEVNGKNGKTTFGFNDRYYEYRRQHSQISEEFKSTLAPFHMGRDLSAGATLNESFIRCNPSDRIFQVNSQTADTLWIMANHHLVARRLVPKRANPRIL